MARKLDEEIADLLGIPSKPDNFLGQEIDGRRWMYRGKWVRFPPPYSSDPKLSAALREVMCNSRRVRTIHFSVFPSNNNSQCVTVTGYLLSVDDSGPHFSACGDSLEDATAKLYRQWKAASDE